MTKEPIRAGKVVTRARKWRITKKMPWKWRSKRQCKVTAGT